MSISGNPANLLASLVKRFGPDLVQQHRWFDEKDRWVELVLAITARCTDLPEHDVRAACEELAEAGALDRPGQIRESATRKVVEAAFGRHGLNAEECNKAVTALGEVSEVVDREFAGKLQIYLRQCLEMVTEHMQDSFPMSTLNRSEARHAFTFWLQNVLAAPLPLAHPDELAYCKTNGVEWDSLIAAADDADINVALLDDMVHAAIRSSREQSKS